MVKKKRLKLKNGLVLETHLNNGGVTRAYFLNGRQLTKSDSQPPQQEDNFHARVQALRSRNEKQDGDCMEILTMLVILAVLFSVSF